MSTLSTVLLLLAGTCGAAEVEAPASSPERIEWTIDGSTRQAIVYAPASAGATAAPVVFAFHGHGGTMQHAARTFAYQSRWPEAIVIYMQGLPTPGMTDPEGKRSGWQKAPGAQGDRDLKFFDAALATIRKDHKVDDRRIYVTGHSNGGGFTYLLWATRGDVFAAMAPSAGGAARQLKDLKPKPAIHVAGETDQIVPFAFQKRTMDAVRSRNGCDSEGQPWGEHGTMYPSKTGTPFVSLVHPGDHRFPDFAPKQIVKFFKEQAKP